MIIITHHFSTVRIALIPAVISVASGVVALVLAAHYPLWPGVAIGIVLVSTALTQAQPALLLLLPALLPILGLAPWTGWITFEELDILVLAAAAGAYAHMAWRRVSNQDHAKVKERNSANLVALAIVLFALSTAISFGRGLVDAGGFAFGWFQGYHEPMNSVRLAKSFFLAVLLVPVWQFLRSRDAVLSQTLLTRSFVAGLVFASLTTIWERVAFPGLLNFSADYRTTGLFWEMHVGGAALDGFLALTTPFAVWALLTARTARTWGILAVALALAAYASLTTFSRGVYLAIPVGSCIVWALHRRQRIHMPQQSPYPKRAASEASYNSGLGRRQFAWSEVLSGAILVVAFAAGASWMFPTSGYRGMAALFAAMALALPVAHVARGLATQQWLAGLMVASLLTLGTWAMSWAVPKGAYAGLLLAVAMTTTMLWRARRRQGRSRVSPALALGGFIATIGGTGMVALHWGGTAGLNSAAPVLLALLVTGLVAALSPRSLWPASLRWQGSTVVLMALVAATTAVFGGGAYMGDRFSTGPQDMELRESHWKLGVDMLQSPADWLLGKGLGRYPSNYFLNGQLDQHPGDYRLKREGENSYLTVSGGLHTNGWSEIFRVSQRIAEPGKAAVASARVRVEHDVALHFEVCEKHLLYGQNCSGKDVGVKGAAGVWQDLRVELQGTDSKRGDWYAPRLIAFSIAMQTKGGLADVDNLTLRRADGLELLSNGNFVTGMSHWFFSSDKYHLPWHMKNMFLHLLFDQGLLGATVLYFMLGWSIWRTSFGAASKHPLAPALAAGMAGFAVVGLFDSLLDVPRLAWLFYLTLLIGLLLPHERGSPNRVIGRGQALRGLATVVLVVATLFQHGSSSAAETATATQLLRVGPSREIRSIAEASRLARNDAVVEVDAGEYVGDVAVWTQDRLVLRAMGGRVQLIARGASAEGKAIWVVRGNQFSADGFDFSGTQVPDHNGAGIRLESGSMRVSNCRFIDNENGILTSNRSDVELDIVDSEFGHNGYGDGLTHNLYVGAIARLSVSGSYFHHALAGHLLKSRAALNDIRYNRLVDGPGGRASYELEFPNGGVAYVVGNIIEQGAKTENPHLISYGAEAYRWPRNALYLIHNTLINDKPAGGVLLRIKPGDVTIQADNNLLIGPGQLEIAGPGSYRNNVRADWNMLEDSAGGNYAPRRGARFAGKLVDPGSADGMTLLPRFQYRQPMGKDALHGKPHNPGALQSSSLNSRP